VEDAGSALERVFLALKHAIVHREVVHIGVPVNVQIQSASGETKPMKGRLPNFGIMPSEDQIQRAAQVMASAERPVIVAGWGSRKQSRTLLEIAERLSAPIATTYRAKGIIREDGPLALGVLGASGTDPARTLVYDADMLLVVGASFSEFTGVPPTRTVQIDIDPMNIAKRSQVEVPLWGNADNVLPKLLRALPEREKNDQRLEEVRRLKAEWSSKKEAEGASKARPIRPPRIIRALESAAERDAIFSIDVGENCHWFGRNFEMKGQELILSGYVGAMGFGLPGALSAKLVHPDRQVICVTGDGGFSMVMADFLTAVRNNLAVKVVIFNNSELAMITQEQKHESYPKFSTALNNPNFAKYAEICGGEGFRAEDPDELEAVLKRAFSSNKPAIVDVITDPKR